MRDRKTWARRLPSELRSRHGGEDEGRLWRVGAQLSLPLLRRAIRHIIDKDRHDEIEDADGDEEKEQNVGHQESATEFTPHTPTVAGHFRT